MPGTPRLARPPTRVIVYFPQRLKKSSRVGRTYPSPDALARLNAPKVIKQPNVKVITTSSANTTSSSLGVTLVRDADGWLRCAPLALAAD